MFWQLFSSFKLARITSADIRRVVALADGFVTNHATLIPVPVHAAWAALRGALLDWENTLAADESRTR